MKKAALFDFMGVVGYTRMAVAGDPGDGPTRTVMHDEIVDVLQHLRSDGLKLALVSNNDRAHFARVAPDVSSRLEELFDAVVYSSDVGTEKPSPVIYNAALAALGVAAEDAHYFDDLSQNVDAAEQLGMSGTVVTRPADVMNAIAGF